MSEQTTETDPVLDDVETPEAVETDEPTEGEQKDQETRDGRRKKGPGTEGYDPALDDLIPNSFLVDQVRAEMTHSEGKSSPTWDALYEEWCKANPETDEE